MEEEPIFAVGGCDDSHGRYRKRLGGDADLRACFTAKIKCSTRRVLVKNLTFGITVFVAVYYKLHSNKGDQKFLRFTSPLSIAPDGRLLLSKPSTSCRKAYDSRIFFSSSQSRLSQEISASYAKQIGSHSVSFVKKLFICVENDILVAFNNYEWNHHRIKVPEEPLEPMIVRSAFETLTDLHPFTDVIDENSENTEEISSEELLQLSEEEEEEEEEEDFFDADSSMDGTTESIEETRNIVDFMHSSNIPLPTTKTSYYRPVKRCPLSKEETEALQNRLTKCTEALYRYIPDLKQEREGKEREGTLPAIALCLSGGSYRALVASLGAIKGMKETGLLDCITYISTLSGSVWSVGMWYSYPDQDLDGLFSDLPNLLKRSFLSYMRTKKVRKAYKEMQNSKKHHQLPRTQISDLYAACLSKQLLSTLGEKTFSYPISQVAKEEKMRNGDLPIPIFTAVFKEPHGYEWMEISPFEAGSDYLSSFVPTEGFGSHFMGGKLVTRHPEITMGQLMGMCSAVFCLTSHRLWKEAVMAYDIHPVENGPTAPFRSSHTNTITYPRPAPQDGSLQEIPIVNLQNLRAGDLALSFIQGLGSQEFLHEPLLTRHDTTLWNEDEDEKIPQKEEILNQDVESSGGSVHKQEVIKKPKKSKRVKAARKVDASLHKSKMAQKYLIRPATLPNFSFGMPSPMKRTKYVQLVDGGMDYCIPLAPLLRTCRNVKVIIVVDMSAPPDCVEGNSLQAGIKWAKEHGYRVPDVRYDCVYAEKLFFVFASDHEDAPTIIYVPLRKNEDYSSFDPVQNYAQGGYCSTSSIKMEAEQIEELSGLLQHTFKQIDQDIKKAIYETFK